MEGNKQSFKKRPNSPQLKNKGGNKKGKWHDSGEDQPFENFRTSDTVYRILCHSRKIGSVIGKGGSIVKALREETQAKITVADSVPGSDERVIIIYSPSTKTSKKHDNEEDSATVMEDDTMKPHCAAQDALLKVHDRIVEEDIVDGVDDEDDDGNMVTARLLVPNNMVGCVLGRKGDVIQRLRSETGASVRVLPSERLPTCAMSTDELVQISGKPAVAKRALFEVSTLLHQNPRKDKPPLNFPMPYAGQGFKPTGPPMSDMFPPGNSLWSRRDSNSRDMVPISWMGEFGDRSAGFERGGYDDIPPMHGGGEAPSEFFMKILCPAGKIGVVIGKGGVNVKQLQQETGASIHVEDASAESEERVIRVSSLEALQNPRSQTVDAIIQLQTKTSEFSEKGIITTRLLVPSSKVGCILGQGGNVINEMRRRTRADIRVYSKEDKPKCAGEDEELVQISGNFTLAKDALAEIASRLRVRFLRDSNAGMEPPVRPAQGFGAVGIPPGGPHPPLTTRVGGSSGYEFPKGGGREYDPPGYPVPPSATRYSNINSSMDMKMSNSAMGSVGRTRGSNNNEVIGTRVKLQDYQSGGSEHGFEIHGSSERLNAAQNILQPYTASGRQNNNPPQGSYQNIPTQYNSYPSLNSVQTQYSNLNSSQTPYQNMSAQQAPYQNMSTQQSPLQNFGAQGSYQYRH